MGGHNIAKWVVTEVGRPWSAGMRYPVATVQVTIQIPLADAEVFQSLRIRVPRDSAPQPGDRVSMSLAWGY